MGWQIFLTVWMLIQLVASTVRQPKLMRLEGKTDSQLSGAIAGNIIKFAGMFACLYFGGFYE